MRRLTSWFVAIALVAVAGVAWAASSDLDSVLGDVEWGDDKDAVVKKMKQQRIEALRNRRDLRHDRIALQKERKKVIDKFEEVEDSYTKLKGEDTGYEVSVISGEFTKDAGEAIMKVSDNAAQRFYFFKDEKLYKLVVAYRNNRLEGVAFKNFLQRVISKYGEPDGVDRAKISGERQLARARWSGAKTNLEVRNERQFFGTFVMVFSDKQRVKKLRAEDGEFGGEGKDEGVSERVKALSAESDDQQEDVVEGMIGEDIEVSLGEPTEEEKTDGDAGDEKKSDEKTAEEDEATASAEASGSDKTASSGGDDDASGSKVGSKSGGSDDDGEATEAGGDEDEEEEKDELIVY